MDRRGPARQRDARLRPGGPRRPPLRRHREQREGRGRPRVPLRRRRASGSTAAPRTGATRSPRWPCTRGKLYAASSKYRFAGSALPESENANRGGGVYRYEGEKRWTEVGRLPDTEAVGGLVVYKGRLYASSLYKPAGFFRYESDGKWTALAVPDGKRVESLGVFNGHLWATSYDGGRVYRYDGKEWKDFGQLGDNTQTYSFAVHRGRLCVGTWPSGKVFRLNDDRWDDLGRLGERTGGDGDAGPQRPALRRHAAAGGGLPLRRRPDVDEDRPSSTRRRT